jgi:hypothetical protein
MVLNAPEGTHGGSFVQREMDNPERPARVEDPPGAWRSLGEPQAAVNQPQPRDLWEPRCPPEAEVKESPSSPIPCTVVQDVGV